MENRGVKVVVDHLNNAYFASDKMVKIGSPVKVTGPKMFGDDVKFILTNRYLSSYFGKSMQNRSARIDELGDNFYLVYFVNEGGEVFNYYYRLVEFVETPHEVNEEVMINQIHDNYESRLKVLESKVTKLEKSIKSLELMTTPSDGLSEDEVAEMKARNNLLTMVRNEGMKYGDPDKFFDKSDEDEGKKDCIKDSIYNSFPSAIKMLMDRVKTKKYGIKDPMELATKCGYKSINSFYYILKNPNSRPKNKTKLAPMLEGVSSQLGLDISCQEWLDLMNE